MITVASISERVVVSPTQNQPICIYLIISI